MAQIWPDADYSISNITESNTNEYFRFGWVYVTFTSEEQFQAQIRWRKAGVFSSVKDRMNVPDSVWSTPVDIGRFEDKTTWVLSGGQYVPPAAANRRYSNIVNYDFPPNYFSAGVWFIQVRIKSIASGTVDADWSAWTTHNIEITAHTAEQYNSGAFDIGSGLTGVTMAPSFPNEGFYAFNVEVMSAAGITSQSADSNTFAAWETNKYLNNGTSVVAVPEHLNNGTQTVRVKRTE